MNLQAMDSAQQFRLPMVDFFTVTALCKWSNCTADGGHRSRFLNRIKANIVLNLLCVAGTTPVSESHSGRSSRVNTRMTRLDSCGNCRPLADATFSSTHENDYYQSSTKCNQTLYIHVHVPKTGGTTVYHRLATYKDFATTVCYPAFQQTCCGREPLQAVFARDFTCGKCSVASAEWTFDRLLSIGLLRATSDARLITFVRNPLMEARSAIEHDIRRGRYHSVQEKLDMIAGKVPSQGYNVMEMQAHHLLPHTKPDDRSSVFAVKANEVESFLARSYFFVGVSDWFFHSMCALEYKLGLFQPRECNCAPAGSAPRRLDAASRAKPVSGATPSYTAVASNVHSEIDANVTYSSAQLHQLNALLRMDGVLYSAAIARLLQLLLEIQKTHHVDLMSCFVR